MKKIILSIGILVALKSCEKPCVECKYSTLKGVKKEVFCSSIKADRDNFKTEWDSLATNFNSTVICTQQDY